MCEAAQQKRKQRTQAGADAGTSGAGRGTREEVGELAKLRKTRRSAPRDGEAADAEMTSPAHGEEQQQRFTERLACNAEEFTERTVMAHEDRGKRERKRAMYPGMISGSPPKRTKAQGKKRASEEVRHTGGAMKLKIRASTKLLERIERGAEERRA